MKTYLLGWLPHKTLKDIAGAFDPRRRKCMLNKEK